jgi:hypothetical protein
MMTSFNLSRGFVGKLSELERTAWESRSMDTLVGVRYVCDCLIGGFVINTDIDEEELRRIQLLSQVENYKYEIYRVIHSAMKLDLLFPKKLNSDSIINQDVYLLDNNVNVPFPYGVISFSEPSELIEKFETWKSFAKEVKKGESYEGILTTPSNSLVMVDPYLIQSKKFDKFIGFLTNFLLKKMTIKFHLTIYSKIDESGSEKQVVELKNMLDNIANLEYEIILATSMPLTNRVFISNYVVGFFAHPFDRDDLVSTIFLPSQIDGVRTAKDYIAEFVRHTNYYSIKESIVQRIYRNNANFTNRLITEICPPKVS